MELHNNDCRGLSILANQQTDTSTSVNYWPVNQLLYALHYTRRLMFNMKLYLGTKEVFETFFQKISEYSCLTLEESKVILDYDHIFVQTCMEIWNWWDIVQEVKVSSNKLKFNAHCWWLSVLGNAPHLMSDQTHYQATAMLTATTPHHHAIQCHDQGPGQDQGHANTEASTTVALARSKQLGPGTSLLAMDFGGTQNPLLLLVIIMDVCWN